MPFTILATDAEIQVPPGIAVCPICGANLYIEMDEWEEDGEGGWKAASPKAQCTTEPSIDSRKWREWHDWHYQMPYVDWLPVEMRIKAWMDKTYRFDLHATSASEEQEKLRRWNENSRGWQQ